jgi:DNA processing protein
MSEHGSAEAALDALPGVARDAGVSDYQVWSEDGARAELRDGRRMGAHLIAYGTPEYPRALMSLSDAPPLIWAKGDLSLLNRSTVAMVGARNASSLGLRMTRKLATDLAEDGHVIASGLARGIDTVAHEATIETGTIAVLAGGIDVVYPPENAKLMNQIAEKGLLVSESMIGLRPQARDFPRRNRIISGLSRAVVVIEAAAKSGSLLTAKNALDQGREVLAVPGHPFDARASGCNMLIRDGAVLVRDAKDVIDALPAEDTPWPDPVAQITPETPVPPAEPEKRTLRETAHLHQQILDRLGPSPLAEDQLIRDLNLSAGQVSPALTTLELDGEITRQPGGLVSRAV